MRRFTAALLTALVPLALSIAPADAAQKPKPKPPPVTEESCAAQGGTYTESKGARSCTVTTTTTTDSYTPGFICTTRIYNNGGNTPGGTIYLQRSWLDGCYNRYVNTETTTTTTTTRRGRTTSTTTTETTDSELDPAFYYVGESSDSCWSRDDDPATQDQMIDMSYCEDLPRDDPERMTNPAKPLPPDAEI